MQMVAVSKPTRLTYSWGKPSRKSGKESSPVKSPTQRPLCFEGASTDAGGLAWKCLQSQRLYPDCEWLGVALLMHLSQFHYGWPGDAGGPALCMLNETNTQLKSVIPALAHQRPSPFDSTRALLTKLCLLVRGQDERRGDR